MKTALQVIASEKSNFQRMVEKKPFGKDPLEPRARTQYSFEKLLEAMKRLSHVRKFRRAAKSVASLCEQELSRPADEREAAEVLALINELEPRLKRRAHWDSAKEEAAVPF